MDSAFLSVHFATACELNNITCNESMLKRHFSVQRMLAGIVSEKEVTYYLECLKPTDVFSILDFFEIW
jgi:hypothetical protein